MIGINEITNSLNSNPNITTEIKQYLLELIIIFNKRFPNVNLNILNERIKTLNIIKGSKFLIVNASKYNVLENTIYINQSKADIVDYKFILMRELLNVITSNKTYSGFNVDNKYEALNNGYTEKLAMFLVGNEAESEFEEEVAVATMLEIIIGEEPLIQAYFSNDINKILSVIG